MRNLKQIDPFVAQWISLALSKPAPGHTLEDMFNGNEADGSGGLIVQNVGGCAFDKAVAATHDRRWALCNLPRLLMTPAIREVWTAAGHPLDMEFTVPSDIIDAAHDPHTQAAAGLFE